MISKSSEWSLWNVKEREESAVQQMTMKAVEAEKRINELEDKVR